MGFILGKENNHYRLDDLAEVYSEIYCRRGRHAATCWYLGQIMRGWPRYVIFRMTGRFMMVKNYLKVAYRNIFRQKGYSLINIIGLALGMTCSFFLLLWVYHQVSFDRFHENVDRLYRVEVDIPQDNGIIHGPNTPHPLGEAIEETLPEIRHMARWQSTPRMLVRYGENVFYERGRAVDPPFLKMFTFPLISGDPESALDHTHSIILSRETAQKYFGEEDPMGKILDVNNQLSLKVTGVMAEFPANSTLTARILVPFNLIKELSNYRDNWLSGDCHTWVELHGGTSESPVAAKITDLYRKRITGLQSQLSGTQVKSITGKNAWTFTLMSLKDMNLYGDNVFRQGMAGRVRIFLLLAIAVLMIACINYMNLATARSAGRAREVGVRKVAGADRKDLMVQFFGESMMVTFLSVLFSLILVMLFLPVFNNLMDQTFSLRSVFGSGFVFYILAVAVLSGMVAGCYPAVFLSSFRPARVLKSNLSAGGKGGMSRKLLVVFQFSLSVVLIVTTIMASRQIRYITNKDMGYEKEHLVYLPLRKETVDSYGILKAELMKDPKILGVTGIQAHPTNIQTDWNDADWEGKDPSTAPLIVYSVVDFDYVETMKITMKAGRSFSRSFPTDKEQAFLVNEEMVKLMGIEDAVGKHFSFLNRTGSIIGVMKNFHHREVTGPIEPLVLVMGGRIYNVVVRLQGGDVQSAIEGLSAAWQRVFPRFPFRFTFFDDDFEYRYREDQHMGSIFKYSAFLAVIIACIGLLGLASFMAERRAREIGIRRVLGASLPGLTVMLSNEFLKLVVMANVVAWPVAYLFIDHWLNDYAFRAPVGWEIFLLAGLITITISVIVVSYQSLKAALANPIKAIMHE